MTPLLLFLIVPGLVVAYALLLRPLLHRVLMLRKFYSEADGAWAKAWAVCGKSLTVLWSYILGGFGASLALIDRIGPVVGDPSLDLETKVKASLSPNVAGYVLIGISLITIAVRVRSLGKAA